MTIQLEPAYFIFGLLTLIFLIIAIIVGIKIISKYFEYKKRVFLLVGLTAILISEPWWPASFGFLIILLTGENLSSEAYLILGVSILPILVLIWLTAFTDLLYKDKQKIILLIFAVYGALFEIVFFILLFSNISLIGEVHGYFDPNYGLFVRAYQFSLLFIVGITGSLFARESLKSDSPEVRLKGKFFFAAIITFIIGSIIDLYAQIDFPSPPSFILVIIARSILIFTAFEFYCSLILPEFVKKLFLGKTTH